MNSFTYDPRFQSPVGTRAFSSTCGADLTAIGCRVTMVFDQSVGLAQPVGERTTTIFCSDRPSLHRLFVDLSKRPPGEIPHDLIDAILTRLERDPKLERACRRTSEEHPPHFNLTEDLMQQTLLQLQILLLNRQLSYDDVGEPQFHAWLWQVILRQARKAERQCVSKFALTLLADVSQLARVAPDSEKADKLEELRAAIPRIPDPDVGHVIEDERRGLTLVKSALLRGFSKSHVWDLRQQGYEWLHSVLSDD